MLHSMHKYVPEVNILKEIPRGSGNFQSVHLEILRVCEFVSVTAYQSNSVCTLKYRVA